MYLTGKEDAVLAFISRRNLLHSSLANPVIDRLVLDTRQKFVENVEIAQVKNVVTAFVPESGIESRLNTVIL